MLLPSSPCYLIISWSNWDEKIFCLETVTQEVLSSLFLAHLMLCSSIQLKTQHPQTNLVCQGVDEDLRPLVNSSGWHYLIPDGSS